ncbi:olfactory receptor 1-like [Polypterus senegalus]|uniref:olfactory receptor 1-like n=1 Tax=Polypterus senegalus TaxID=55291 RepID=UPI001962A40B|nr:olfactory receptor 1-like [Polypterus senegalus]
MDFEAADHIIDRIIKVTYQYTSDWPLYIEIFKDFKQLAKQTSLTYQRFNKTASTVSNMTVSVSEFILHCPISYEQRDLTVSILFFIYLVTLLGNALVILVIIMNHQLQKPMYLYISTLAAIDLINSSNLIPKMIAVLFDSAAIPYGPCVLQMYIVYHLEVAESLIFVFMAGDRYMAVLHPLRYPSLVTNKTVWITVFLSNFISAMVITPYVVYVNEVHFCVTNILPYCFCDYATMIHVSCGTDPKYLATLSTTASIFCIGPITLILFSYIRIAQAALKITSSDGKSHLGDFLFLQGIMADFQDRMMIAFFYIDELVHKEFLHQEQTAYEQHYAELLRHLQENTMKRTS